MTTPSRSTIRKRAGTTTTKKTTEHTSIFDRATGPGEVTHVKGILFGPPKSGKTSAATNTSGKVLLVEMEPEGDLALRGKDNITVVRPDNWKDLNEIVTELHTARKEEWDTVVFDSITFMFELIGAKEILRSLQENKDARRPYQNAGAAVNQIIHDSVRLPMNVIFITQLKAETGGDDDVTPLNPEEGDYPLTLAVTPMVYKILSPAVSFIGRTYRKQGWDRSVQPAKKVSEFWVSFNDFGRSPAGDRLGLPEQVQNLNLDELLAHAQRKETE